MEFRTIVPDKDSTKQPYQYFLIGLFWSFVGFSFALNISDLLPFLSFSKQFKNELTGLSFFILLGCFIGLIATMLMRDRVPYIQVDKMRIKAKVIAWFIRDAFSNKVLINNLGFDVKTCYGFAMPKVVVFVEDDCNAGWVAIENLGNNKNMDSDGFLKRLSGLLNRRLIQRFSFVSCSLSNDGNFYKYHFEDTATSQRLIVRNGDMTPYISDNTNDVLLAKDLIWHTKLTPHLAVIARTRGGKSTFTGSYLIPLLKAQGWAVNLFSVKNDKYIQKFKGESDPIKIIDKLELLEKDMKRREDLIAKAGKDNFSQMSGMPNVAIVIDEVARMNAFLSDKGNKALLDRWNAVIKSLTGSGASSGYHVIAMSQRSTKDGFFMSGTAVTNMADAVIMLGLAADSGKDRETLMAGFEIPHRSYGYGQGIARIVTSGSKWEQPHFYETPYIC